jgi:flagellar biogenesis protein FliO
MEAGSMTDWIASYVGDQYAQNVAYGVWGLAALLGLLFVIWLIRKFSHGTFISGGRNAQPRLAVQDATPVDSHRRLVLVRRDDVEHLLLIGGNTDIVVEQNIRPFGATARPMREAEPIQQRQAAPELPSYPPQRPVQPAPPPRPVVSGQAPRPVAPAAPAQRYEPQAPAPAPVPVAPPVRTDPPAQSQSFRVEPQQAAPAPGAGLSVDDELEKMLSDFGGYTPKRPECLHDLSYGLRRQNQTGIAERRGLSGER